MYMHVLCIYECASDFLLMHGCYRYEWNVLHRGNALLFAELQLLLSGFPLSLVFLNQNRCHLAMLNFLKLSHEMSWKFCWICLLMIKCLLGHAWNLWKMYITMHDSYEMLIWLMEELWKSVLGRGGSLVTMWTVMRCWCMHLQGWNLCFVWAYLVSQIDQ